MGTGNGTKALTLNMSCDTPTTPRRSPKKANRSTAEKSVSTSESFQYRRAATPETPTKTPTQESKASSILVPLCASGLTAKKDTRSLMRSSQASYYEGDEEFEEILNQMDDQEVESLLGRKLPTEKLPATDSSVSSSASSINTATSTSTIATSFGSSVVDESQRRRKRDDSPTNDCPRRRARPASPSDVSKQFQKTTTHRDQSATAVAAHSTRSKQDRPMLRKMRDPGHVNPVAVTSNVVVNADIIAASDLPSRAIPALKETAEPGAVEVSRTSIEIIDLVADDPAEPVSKPLPVNGKAPSRVDSIGPSRARRPKTGVKARINGESSVAKPTSKDVSIIVHDKAKQWLLDDQGIAKGVQFEIARGITRGWWAWEDITEGVVKSLRGTNFEKAGKVAEIIGKEAHERLSQAVIHTRQNIYAELDREQEAYLENKGRGLGLMGAWQGVENWYGGRVQFTAKLEFTKSERKGEPPCSIRLNSFGYGKSTRAARFATSLSILQVKYEKGALYDEKRYKLILELCSKPLVICGRQYRAFCTKECKIFFVESKEDYERREPVRSLGDHFRMSYRRFRRIVNPMELNSEQAISKWGTRWQLILSTSKPVLEFLPEHIFLYLDDIYAEGAGPGKKSAETIMTDGCGFINFSAMKLIAAITGANCPRVIQGRLAGAKGLWLLHPEHQDPSEPPMIWIRASQIKIKLPPKETWDRSLRIFDIVRLPRLTVPSSLNKQTIVNMSHNGVKNSVFKKLMEASLNKASEPLTNWESEKACVSLARAVEEAGGVLASRRSRGAGGEARLRGYVRDEDEDSDDDLDEGALVERDPISGCPSSLFESTREMLLAGFSPLQNWVVREKLKYILTQTLKGFVHQHISVPMSAEAFIAPDPYGVLNEGEVYFRCSVPVGDPTTQADPCTFLGPVLVSRNPTRVASDIQKVIAVTHDRLLPYTDVILFSTKGKRSLASYLGGGDYDGDTVTVFADPALVEAFSNAELVSEPSCVREAFEEEIETGAAFMKRVDPTSIDSEICKKVLTGLTDGKVGVYSDMHDNATYVDGYNAPETIRLAYMFTTCLDANKSGLRIKADVFKEDSKKWNKPKPECLQKAEEAMRIDSYKAAGPRLIRPSRLGPFVLDSIKTYAKDLGDQALIRYEKLCDSASSKLDADLLIPHQCLKAFASSIKEDSLYQKLQEIERFIESLCEQYVADMGKFFGSRSPQKGGANGSTTTNNPPSRIQNDFSHRFEQEFTDPLGLPPQWVRQFKASYAYVCGSNRSGVLGKGFAFAVAHDVLCGIKNSNGGASLSRESRDFTLVSSNLVKLVCDN